MISRTSSSSLATLVANANSLLLANLNSTNQTQSPKNLTPQSQNANQPNSQDASNPASNQPTSNTALSTNTITSTVTSTSITKQIAAPIQPIQVSLEIPLLPIEKLYPTPSMLDNLAYDVEFDLRLTGCELIQTAGRLLNLSQTAMATGQVLFHRFYYTKSFVKNPMEYYSMAAIYLSSKIEECPRRIRHVLNVFHHIKQVRTGKVIKPMPVDENYHEIKNQVIKAERRILKELGFCVHVKHPHKIIFVYLQAIECSTTELSQKAWNYMNDSLRTDIFLRYKPENIACACIDLSARELQISLPQNPPWYTIFGADEESIKEICIRILYLYTHVTRSQDELERLVNDCREQLDQEKRRTKEAALAAANTTPAQVQQTEVSPKELPSEKPIETKPATEPVPVKPILPSDTSKVSSNFNIHSYSQNAQHAHHHPHHHSHHNSHHRPPHHLNPLAGVKNKSFSNMPMDTSVLSHNNPYHLNNTHMSRHSSFNCNYDYYQHPPYMNAVPYGAPYNEREYYNENAYYDISLKKTKSSSALLPSSHHDDYPHRHSHHPKHSKSSSKDQSSRDKTSRDKYSRTKGYEYRKSRSRSRSKSRSRSRSPPKKVSQEKKTHRSSKRQASGSRSRSIDSVEMDNLSDHGSKSNSSKHKKKKSSHHSRRKEDRHRKERENDTARYEKVHS